MYISIDWDDEQNLPKETKSRLTAADRKYEAVAKKACNEYILEMQSLWRTHHNSLVYWNNNSLIPSEAGGWTEICESAKEKLSQRINPALEELFKAVESVAAAAGLTRIEVEECCSRRAIYTSSPKDVKERYKG